MGTDQVGRNILIRMIYGGQISLMIRLTLALLAVTIDAAIISEAYLSFLGFGVLPPTATWGNILTRAQSQIDRR